MSNPKRIVMKQHHAVDLGGGSVLRLSAGSHYSFSDGLGEQLVAEGVAYREGEEPVEEPAPLAIEVAAEMPSVLESLPSDGDVGHAPGEE